jgi:hypothetical protein
LTIGVAAEELVLVTLDEVLVAEEVVELVVAELGAAVALAASVGIDAVAAASRRTWAPADAAVFGAWTLVSAISCLMSAWVMATGLGAAYSRETEPRSAYV